MSPLSLTNPLPIHVITVDIEPEVGEDLTDYLKAGALEDIGLGLTWGIATANVTSLTRKKITLAYAPDLHKVLYLVRPGELTVH